MVKKVFLLLLILHSKKKNFKSIPAKVMVDALKILAGLTLSLGD